VSLDPRNLPPMPELMIVGPGELHDEDLAVLGRQVIAHYGDAWVELHDATLDALARLLGAHEPPFLIPGSGTVCLDAAMMNVFTPGQTVVVANTGFFGVRLIEVARAVRLNVVEVAVEAGAPADPDALAEAARAHAAAGILVTQVDTSTGVRHPVAGIARAAHDAGALCFVDGIASIGGEMFDMRAMDVDVLVTATQKGLETPPGLGIVALGPRARAAMEVRAEPPPSWYLDLKRWDWYRENWTWHPHPVTMPTNLVLALSSSLQRILGAGLQPWVDARAALSERLRQGLRDIGFEPVPQRGVESNMVVAAWADDATELLGYLLRNGLQISGGLAPLAGRSIRIGLMGRTANEAMVAKVLDLLARARKEPR
jgi:alanine-glyoxylate transaminase/serine-glyoxylate transaminase/serine-pyruvate transaminase